MIIVMATKGELPSLLISESYYSEGPMVEHVVDTSPVVSCITHYSNTSCGKEKQSTDILSFCKQCPHCSFDWRRLPPQASPLIDTCRATLSKDKSQHNTSTMYRSWKQTCIVFQDMLTKWPMVFLVPDWEVSETPFVNKLFHCLEFLKHFFLVEELTFSPTLCKMSVLRKAEHNRLSPWVWRIGRAF